MSKLAVLVLSVIAGSTASASVNIYKRYEYKCSDGKNYDVAYHYSGLGGEYSQWTAGIICQKGTLKSSAYDGMLPESQLTDIKSCISDEAPATKTCFNEYQQLNQTTGNGHDTFSVKHGRQDTPVATTPAQKGDPATCSALAPIQHKHSITSYNIRVYNVKRTTSTLEENKANLNAMLTSTHQQLQDMSTLLNSQTHAKNLQDTQAILSEIKNQRLSSENSIELMIRGIATLRVNYRDLLATTKCTPEQLQSCIYNKENGQRVAKINTIQDYITHYPSVREGKTEVQACIQAPAAITPIIDKPLVTPSIQETEQTQEQQVEPVVQ